MKLKKAMIENSDKELKAYTDHMKMPDVMFNPTDGKSGNSTETKVSAKPTDPDNEQLVIQIERHCMLSNFKKANDLLMDNYDKLTVGDINRLVQFSRFIHNVDMRNMAVPKEKPEDGERFIAKFMRIIQKKMSPK